MPTAIKQTTTPTRRAALALSVAAFVKPPLLPWRGGPRPTGGLADADPLEALVRDLERKEKITHVIAAEGKLLPPGISPASRDQEQRLGGALDDWAETAEQIIDTPATSPAGLRAKAEALRLVLLCNCCDWGSKVEDIHESEAHERLAWSLVNDLLGSAAA